MAVNRRNQKGLATIETVLLMFIFVLFISFSVGFFGVVHVGILNSISARAYAFETLRNRANATFFRNPINPNDQPETLKSIGYRVHGVVKNDNNNQWQNSAQQLPISIASTDADIVRKPASNKNNLRDAKSNPVQIKTAYGLCLTAKCGD